MDKAKSNKQSYHTPIFIHTKKASNHDVGANDGVKVEKTVTVNGAREWCKKDRFRCINRMKLYEYNRSS